MKVIGAGFGRTGTMSLKAALEQIGFGPSFHMIDLIREPEPLPSWQAAAAGETVDWTEILDGWESSVDWPGCSFWEQMSETWPDAPVLLSVRDPESWYRSCLNSIHAAKEMALRGELEGGSEDPPDPAVVQFINGLIWNGTFNGRFLEKDYALEVFHRHNEDVKSKVPSDRLLVYDITQGWGPLCSFLGVPVPDAPLPHLNDTESFRSMFGMPALAS
ncbi:MAG TPA: sulfotransferase [Thermoleophilaceae bacterium]|nr:sulfotransferase [Thermoleophilaceae bacterium]